MVPVAKKNKEVKSCLAMQLDTFASSSSNVFMEYAKFDGKVRNVWAVLELLPNQIKELDVVPLKTAEVFISAVSTSFCFQVLLSKMGWGWGDMTTSTFQVC